MPPKKLEPTWLRTVVDVVVASADAAFAFAAVAAAAKFWVLCATDLKTRFENEAPFIWKYGGDLKTRFENEAPFTCKYGGQSMLVA